MILDSETKAVELCSVCHGPRGVSTSAEFPILAAQQRGYIELQLPVSDFGTLMKAAQSHKKEFKGGYTYKLNI